jgi:predicted GIY-YIG superfamily endonuclease
MVLLDTAYDVYVLALKKGRYYVGRTLAGGDGDMDRAIKGHFEGRGGAWTNLWKPIYIVSKHRGKDRLWETNEVYRLMRQHGIENVRGGRWSSLTLSPEDLEEIRKSYFRLTWQNLDHETAAS